MSQLTDNFGRVHDYLRISLTEKCNLRCTYCMPEEGVPLKPKAHFMNTEEVIGIAQVFVNQGIRKIRLTGGEPLLRKDFSEILLALSKLPVDLTFTTNGVLLDRYMDVILSAGVKSINISLDTLEEARFKTITRRTDFQRVMDNIALTKAKGIGVKINVVLMRGVNDDEIIPFIEKTLAEDLDIRFIEFMPFDGNNWDWNKKVSQKEILQIAFDHFGPDAIQPLNIAPNTTTREFSVQGAKGRFGIISTVTHPFCDTCNRIRLTADGKIKNCLFSNQETDLLTAYRNGVDILPLIQQNIGLKEHSRGGLDMSKPELVQLHENRSMITIGG